VLELPLSGDYRVRVFADGNRTGTYAFRLLDLGTATPIDLGTQVDGTLNPSNETDLYRFSANAGDRFYFDVRALSPNNGDWASWRLLDPLGRPVWGPSGFYVNNDVETTALALGGPYTLLIEGRNWVPANGVASFGYSFAVLPVVDDAPAALTLGQRVDGSLGVAGQRDTYTFTLAAERTLYFDALAGANTFSWSLAGPDGTVASRNFRASDAADLGGASPLLRLPAGAYTLTVDASLDATGAYAFRLRDLRAEATAIGTDTDIAGTLDPAAVCTVWLPPSPVDRCR
jgi:large repetitive protein